MMYSPSLPEKAYYDELFRFANRSGGATLSSNDAVLFLSKSGLKRESLRDVWNVAMDGKSEVGISEFYDLMRAIAISKAGKPLTKEVLSNQGEMIPLVAFSDVNVPIPNLTVADEASPQAQAPPPAIAAQAPPPAIAAQAPPPAIAAQAPPPAMAAQAPPPAMAAQAPPQPNFETSSVSSATSTSTGQWAMTDQEKQQYETFYGQQPKEANGLLGGKHAVVYFQRSRLGNDLLRQIWAMSDMDKDGFLTATEFCIAMHLIMCVSKRNMSLPPTLPSELASMVHGSSANARPSLPHGSSNSSIRAEYSDYNSGMPVNSPMHGQTQQPQTQSQPQLQQTQPQLQPQSQTQPQLQAQMPLQSQQQPHAQLQHHMSAEATASQARLNSYTSGLSQGSGLSAQSTPMAQHLPQQVPSQSIESAMAQHLPQQVPSQSIESTPEAQRILQVATPNLPAVVSVDQGDTNVDTLAAISTDGSQANSALAKLEQHIKTATERTKSEQSRIKGELESLGKERNRLLSDLEAAEKELAKENLTLESLDSELVELRKQVSELEKKVSNTKVNMSEKNDLTRKLNDLKVSESQSTPAQAPTSSVTGIPNRPAPALKDPFPTETPVGADSDPFPKSIPSRPAPSLAAVNGQQTTPQAVGNGDVNAFDGAFPDTTADSSNAWAGFDVGDDFNKAFPSKGDDFSNAFPSDPFANT